MLPRISGGESLLGYVHIYSQRIDAYLWYSRADALLREKTRMGMLGVWHRSELRLLHITRGIYFFANRLGPTMPGKNLHKVEFFTKTH